MTEAINDGRIKALQVIGDSLHFYNGELGDFADAIKKLDFLVVQDTFPSELSETADVVLPSLTFANKEGTYTNLERRVQLLRPALGPKGDEDIDWRIICQIAKRMGAEGFDYGVAEEIFDEFNDLWQAYGGISYRRLQSAGLQWPCAAADMVDTPILYTTGFRSGKASLTPMELTEAPVHENEDYPFLLARGRVLNQPEREIGIELIDDRNAVRRNDIVQIHPEDAAELGISEGDWMEVTSSQGVVRGSAQLDGPQRGLLSVTELFGQLITELENSKDPDAMSKVPLLPLMPARAAKMAAEVAAD